MTIRVLLAMERELLRTGVRAVLSAVHDIELVEEQSPKRYTLGCVEDQPHVVVLDRVATQASSDDDRWITSVAGRCLIVTGDLPDDAFRRAIRAGVAGFLLDHASAADLVDSVRLIAAGGSLLDPALATRLVEQLRHGLSFGTRSGLPADLSARELSLLEHLGEGLSNREIAARMELAEKTVKNYVSKLLRRLEMSSRTEVAVFVVNRKAATLGHRLGPADHGSPAERASVSR